MIRVSIEVEQAGRVLHVEERDDLEVVGGLTTGQTIDRVNTLTRRASEKAVAALSTEAR